MEKNREKGFTLIELLVVISIIALLLSILMPSLTKVKNQARGIVCRSNLKQLSVALATYSAENNDKSLSTTFRISESPVDWSPYSWFQVLAPYFGETKYKNNPQAALGSSMRTLWCPSTKDPIDPYPAVGMGDNKHRWRFHVKDAEGEGSYGINMWVGGMDIDVQVEDFGYIKPGQARKCSLRDSQARSDTPVFADSPWSGGIPMDLDQSTFTLPQSPPPYIDDPDYSFNPARDDYGMRRFCIDRHDMAVSVAFSDASVDKVKLDKLWSLKWNKSFNTISRVELK